MRSGIDFSAFQNGEIPDYYDPEEHARNERDKIIREEVQPLFDLAKSKDPYIRQDAVRALATLVSMNYDKHETLVNIGTLKLFVELSHSDHPIIQLDAAWALSNFAKNTDIDKEKIVKEGAVVPLIRLANSNDKTVRADALNAIHELAKDEDNRFPMVECDVMTPLTNLAFNPDVETSRRAMSTIPILSLDDAAKARIVRDGWMVKLNELAKHCDIQVQRDILYTIGNISTLESCREALVEEGCLDTLSDLLTSWDSHSRHFSVWALANLSQSKPLRKQLIDKGLLPVLFKLLHRPERDLRRDIIHITANVASEPEYRPLVVELGGVGRILNLMLKTMDNDSKKDVLWLLCSLVREDQYIQTLVRLGTIQLMRKCVDSQDNRIQLDSLKVVTRISMYPQYKQEICEHHLDHLVMYSRPHFENVVVFRLTTRVLANLAMDDNLRIKVMASGVLPQLLNLLKKYANPKQFDEQITYSVARCFVNLCETDMVKQRLCDNGAMTVLVPLVKMDDKPIIQGMAEYLIGSMGEVKPTGGTGKSGQGEDSWGASEEEHKAATKIQTLWRAQHARKMYRAALLKEAERKAARLKKKSNKLAKKNEKAGGGPRRMKLTDDQAATRIQSWYRRRRASIQANDKAIDDIMTKVNIMSEVAAMTDVSKIRKELGYDEKEKKKKKKGDRRDSIAQNKRDSIAPRGQGAMTSIGRVEPGRLSRSDSIAKKGTGRKK